MKAKYTPGPWVFFHDCSCVFQKSSKRLICDVDRSNATGNYSHWKRTHDDMRLIAAAPDLLKALQDIAEQLAGHPEASVGNSKVHYSMHMARAAIVKAVLP